MKEILTPGRHNEPENIILGLAYNFERDMTENRGCALKSGISEESSEDERRHQYEEVYMNGNRLIHRTK